MFKSCLHRPQTHLYVLVSDMQLSSSSSFVEVNGDVNRARHCEYKSTTMVVVLSLPVPLIKANIDSWHYHYHYDIHSARLILRAVESTKELIS